VVNIAGMSVPAWPVGGQYCKNVRRHSPTRWSTSQEWSCIMRRRVVNIVGITSGNWWSACQEWLVTIARMRGHDA